MPVHEFLHEASGKKIEIYVPINAPAEQHQVQVVDGDTYKRVYAAPLASIDTHLKDATQEDFRRLTTNKKNLTVGQMWEMSSEMSHHRAEKNGGVDDVKEKFYSNYEKQMGKKHIDVEKREKLKIAHQQLKDMGIRVEL